ncbi:methylmalonyl-CoA mutase, partial [Candidatus Sumerlaeota bacterium]|nr:methylmalonyl-CoA mutase [Candidatus Sumerlaeota bacterium]
NGSAGDQGEIETFAIDDRLESDQIARLQEFRKRRDGAAAHKALEELRKAAQDEKEGLMPHIVEAVRKRATIGEICNVMRDVFGEHRDNVSL